MSASGWCPPFLHPIGHGICQERLDAGLLDGCDCPMHGGHRATAPGPIAVETTTAPLEVAS